MSIINWSDSLSVGIESIDKQHKELIGMINSLNTAIASGEANLIVASILDKLTKYTNYHFEYEEQLFEKYGYPASEEHKRQHALLIDQVLSLKDQYECDLSGSMGLEILQFLKSWLTNHILKTDMDYSEYLASKGVK